MSSIIRVGNKVRSFDSSPQFQTYTKVILNVTDDLFYASGTDTGRTLTLSCPWATQAMADNILKRMQGFRYQPYEATGAVIDPAAEIGDGVDVGSVYSGIFKMDLHLGRRPVADISAPGEEEIDTEYPYKTKTEREISRVRSEMKSEFKVQADQIAAKVSRTGGDSKSFGWTLTEEGFVLASGSSEVFRADETGVSVTGKITATSGFIGNGSAGFTIGSKAIYNGVLSMADTAHFGIYLGTDGIVLGKGAFKVDSQGNLTATSGTFSGYVKAGKIQYGGDSGTLSGGAITAQTISGGSGGAIRGSTLSNFNLSGGVNTSLGYADYSNLVFNGINRIPNILSSNANITQLIVGNRLTIGQKRVGTSVISFKNSQDTITTVNVLTWEDI